MSEDDEWEKDEVEEVVLTSATDFEPAVHATLDSLSCPQGGTSYICIWGCAYGG